MQSERQTLFLISLSLAAVLVLGIASGEEKGVVYGLLYVSPPGDLSYDVMLGRGEEVLLLKGDGNLEAELQALKERRLQQLQEQNRTVLKARREMQVIRPNETRRDRERKRDTLMLAVQALQELETTYKKELDTLIAEYVIQQTKTDQEGKFRFQELSAGRYLLHARFRILGTTILYTWLFPVELQAGEEQEVHLNKSAAISLYY